MKAILVCKAAIKNIKNVHEYSQYLTHNEEQRTFIQDIPSGEDIPSFDAITGYLKTFLKSKKKRCKYESEE